MELTGEQQIATSRQKVWDALNDPAILSGCVPGCEEIVKVSETEMHARVLLKIGPVRARFAGKIFLADIDAPNSCTLSFEGAGGAAGFAKGSSQVRLSDDGQMTVLRYTVAASVGGKLGQIGGRLIDSSARKMADEFFTAFNAALTDSGVDSSVDSSVGSNVDSSAAAVDPVNQAATGASPILRTRQAARLEAQPFSGGFRPELYRVFWFSFGAAFALLISRCFS